MYNIIIVDDERIVREGLCAFFEDGKLGFNVVASFGDGKKAFEYLEKNIEDVDVVLTDITMPLISGLDLIKMIGETEMDVETILITGYNEFEYAQKAVRYGVYRYLLKPVKFHELGEVFIELKQKLDSKPKKVLIEENHERIQLLINQFLIELYSGIFENVEAARKRMIKLKINENFANKPCVIAEIMRNIDDLCEEDKWKYNCERFDNAILNAVRNEDIEYYLLKSNKERLVIIAIPKDDCEEEFLKKAVNCIKNGIEDLKQIFLMEVEVTMLEQCETVFQVIEKTSLNNDDIKIKNLQQMLVADAVSGDKNMIEKLLKLLASKLRETDEHDARKVFESLKDLFERTDENIDNIDVDILAKNIVSSTCDEVNNSVIVRALKYIDENYCKDIYVSDVAKHVCLNPVYFGRLFKIYTGENFTDYLIDMRLKKAMELLEQGTMKVAEVSESVGYSNVKYFSRLFKARTGKTPNDYKRERML